jgi:hypothetical protein
MMPMLLPGVRYGSELAHSLRDLSFRAQNLRSAQQEIEAMAGAYLSMCADAVTNLRHSVREDSLSRLVLTQRYWAILGMGHASRAARELVDLELVDMSSRLAQAASDVDAECRAWNEPDHVVVPDTNVFLHAITGPMSEAPWREMSECRPQMRVNVVLLLAVVDELDKHKHTNARTRARAVIRELDGMLSGAMSVTLAAETSEASAIRLTVMADDPGHIPLTHADSEIVDRCLALESRLPNPLKVHLVTGDLGMALRARRAGLTCHVVDTA